MQTKFKALIALGIFILSLIFISATLFFKMPSLFSNTLLATKVNASEFSILVEEPDIGLLNGSS